LLGGAATAGHDCCDAERDGLTNALKLGQFQVIGCRMPGAVGADRGADPQHLLIGGHEMTIANRRLILAVCALSIAEVAMAAIPKATVDSDVKDARVANVTATSPKGDTNSYTCDYGWQISFHGGVETTDYCEIVIPPDTKNAVVCTKKYDKRISTITLVQSSCKITPP